MSHCPRKDECYPAPQALLTLRQQEKQDQKKSEIDRLRACELFLIMFTSPLRPIGEGRIRISVQRCRLSSRLSEAIALPGFRFDPARMRMARLATTQLEERRHRPAVSNYRMAVTAANSITWRQLHSEARSVGNPTRPTMSMHVHILASDPSCECSAGLQAQHTASKSSSHAHAKTSLCLHWTVSSDPRFGKDAIETTQTRQTGSVAP